jgi:type I restriction enzyme, R subunit
MVKEQEIEKELIQKLMNLKYVYREDICDRISLEANFRAKFNELNRVHLTDNEFTRLLDAIITPDTYQAAKLLRERNTFERDDGTPLHYTIVNTKDWCKNSFEVVSQLRINTDNSHHRYDVILLINGVPVVQVELKNLSIAPRRAMQQIVEYKNDIGNGYSKTLLCFIQLFVVSNRTETLYFANNNARHFSFDAQERFLPIYQYADNDNTPVTHLDSFAEKFLAKCTLGQMISRYMVLVASEQKLLMMRPYQIYAVKAIVDCIQQHSGNGYIWHTTGSGKTLTSFKASTLLKDNDDIDKCLFVVDRKDLDRQTREEFNRFQEGCVEANTNTESLVQRLLSDDKSDKVIVTTIQKLGLALDESSPRNRSKQKHGQETYKKRLEPLRNKRMVFIFDECHRSQFGDNHDAIKEFFPNAQLFGFTGTPIFPENAIYQKIEGEQGSRKTTEDIFQKQLHAYTITNAIEDRNVLKFHVDHYQPEGNTRIKAGETIAKKAVVEAILEKHNAVTADRKFNAIFATSSINDAIEYYELFKKMQCELQAENQDFVPLQIACVFSPPAEGNKDIKQMQDDCPQEKEDNKHEPHKKKAALEAIIADYNQRYQTNHNINDFDLYYQDVQKRIKDQQYPNRDLPHSQKIDVVIVVDMLLTGFDSKYLNTLYVDKNLKHHGLIQAFSRTNRVLNDTKPAGNILDFRGQKEAVDEAIKMFSDVNKEHAVKIWLAEPAPVVIAQLENAVQKLDHFMQSHGLSNKPEDVFRLKGDIARTQFMHHFKEVQRLSTQLNQYTDLKPEDRQHIENILPKEQLQAFKGAYISTAQQLKPQQDNVDADTPSEVQELDFELVLFSSVVIDYDYIMSLLARYSQQNPRNQKTYPEELIALLQSDAKFIDDREDIAEYIRMLTVGEGLTEKEIRDRYAAFMANKQAKELSDLADKHGLEVSRMQAFIDTILRRMIFDSDLLRDLLEPLQLGWKARNQKELALMEDLAPLLLKRAGGREISGLNAYD